eukprot:1337011-Alexandrium_andersonii.AAC.1
MPARAVPRPREHKQLHPPRDSEVQRVRNRPIAPSANHSAPPNVAHARRSEHVERVHCSPVAVPNRPYTASCRRAHSRPPGYGTE